MKQNRKFSEGAETHHKKVFDRFTVQGSGIGEFVSKMSSELMDAGTYAWIVIIIFFLLFTAVRNRFTEQKLSSNNNKPTDFSIHKNESFFACFLGPLNRNHYVFMCSSALCSIHFRLCTTFNEKQKKNMSSASPNKKIAFEHFSNFFFSVLNVSIHYKSVLQMNRYLPAERKRRRKKSTKNLFSSVLSFYCSTFKENRYQHVASANDGNIKEFHIYIVATNEESNY